MIVGVDISTYAVHTAWLEPDRSPRRWHCVLGDDKTHVIDRVRRVHMQWPAKVEEIVIEYPYSTNRKTNAHLMAVAGAVTKSTPSYTRVTWEGSQRLRAELGARNNKAAAAEAVMWADPPLIDRPGQLAFWDNNEIDALVAALAWARLLNQQEAP